MSTTFAEFLNVYWLRPETALWRELDVRAMRDFEVRAPSVDLGCGDGLFSFIRAGGRLSEGFDAFQSVTNLDQFFESVDVFDVFERVAGEVVASPPGYEIDLGFDHKPNLLSKASGLGLYKKLAQGDANVRLEYQAESFNSVFSNIVYWLDEPAAVIGEIARILRPGGRACLMLPNSSLPEYSFYNQLYVKSADPSWAFLQKLDRGRFADNIRQARSADEWESMFATAGLTVTAHTTHLSKLTIQLWDVGLRPLFPVLKKMADGLDSVHRTAIKREWIETARMFLEPLLDLDARPAEDAPGFHCYVLEK